MLKQWDYCCTAIKKQRLSTNLSKPKTNSMPPFQSQKRSYQREPNAIFVRGAKTPRGAENISAYFRAAAGVSNTIGLSKSHMLKNKHFKDLTNVSYTPFPARDAHITNYLGLIGKSYRKQEKRSEQELMKKSEALVGKLSEEAPESESDLDRENRIRKALRKLENAHTPKVNTVPGRTEFDHLSNAIEYLSSQKTICFCVDVEAFERNTNVVTEIGISIYDPRESQFSTVPILRTYHLIVAESLKLRNGRFVCDLKDCFLKGESYVMSLSNCVKFIQTLINYYMVPATAAEHTWKRAFVGHNVKGDLKWLCSIGVQLPNTIDYNFSQSKSPLTVNVIDTERLFRSSYGSKGSSLGKILRLFEVPHAFLHNAGNDAYYTLKLALHMCDVQHRNLLEMDDLYAVVDKIETWAKRDTMEAKILPLSYVNAAIEFTDPSIKKKTVHQTEFGGCVWVEDPIASLTGQL
ncbi:LAFA_0G01068g1_1 [Lachancea sp. 'fantastica']|nr:LAFA_0G01068g1_1 [Lachancea sp. 'fantastica']